jgi:MoxR-like ATPase
MTSNWAHRDFPERVELPPQGHLPAFVHLFDDRTVWALKAAMAARRPLLVRGEPGTGKSQLARAAAAVRRCPLVSTVITSRTEAEDLHFRFDAVARLGQAQMLSAVGQGASLVSLEERRFVEPGPLWWVFDWEGAMLQREYATAKGPPPQAPDGWHSSLGVVLLIDEIDKADSDLPNGLLESLGNGEFRVPYLSHPVSCSPKYTPPLVLITTNEERELPAAFVRRCFVLALALPEGQALVQFLVERGTAHFGRRCSPAVYEAAARMLAQDREEREADGTARPGQAEYLDLLRATLEIARDDGEEQMKVLLEIHAFALSKGSSTWG